MSTAHRRPRVLAPRNNPFANDGSAQSFSKAGAPIFRHPTQCRGWSPLLSQTDDSVNTRLSSNIRRAHAQLDALRITIRDISNDSQVLEICKRSNPICGHQCCLGSRTNTENNSVNRFPEKWWDGPIPASSISTCHHHSRASTGTLRNRDSRTRSNDPSVWWAGVVSSGPQLSPLPPLVTTTSSGQSIPGTNIIGARASPVRQQTRVLAPPRIREPPIRPTSLSVSSSSTSLHSKITRQQVLRKPLSRTSSSTSTGCSTPTISSRSRSHGYESTNQVPHRFTNPRHPTTTHQAPGSILSPTTLSTTYIRNSTSTQDDSDPTPMPQRPGVTTLTVSDNTYGQQELKSMSLPSSSTNTSTSSIPQQKHSSAPTSPSQYRRRRQLRARRVLPPKQIRLATSPTTPEGSGNVPLEIPQFSSPKLKEQVQSAPLPQSSPTSAEDSEKEQVELLKRRAELARLLADSKPGKTFHPGSGSATNTPTTESTTNDQVSPDTENFGMGVIIVSLLLLIALLLIHGQLT